MTDDRMQQKGLLSAEARKSPLAENERVSKRVLEAYARAVGSRPVRLEDLCGTLSNMVSVRREWVH